VSSFADRPSSDRTPRAFARTVVGICTGDGRFVLHAARSDAGSLVIGIDADTSSTVRLSRKAEAEGLENTMFVVAAAGSLPPELDSRVAGVRIQFPWGSLLRGIVEVDDAVVAPIVRLCAPGAEITALISVVERDHSARAFDPVVVGPRLRRSGLELVEARRSGMTHRLVTGPRPRARRRRARTRRQTQEHRTSPRRPCSRESPSREREATHQLMAENHAWDGDVRTVCEKSPRHECRHDEERGQCILVSTGDLIEDQSRDSNGAPEEARAPIGADSLLSVSELELLSNRDPNSDRWAKRSRSITYGSGC
jgi:hypothetical protein